MANPIIKILRGATPPSATLQAGQLAMDQVAKNLYLGVEVGGVVTNEIVAGSGTFATKSYVDTAVSTGTGSLGTMSTQDADAVAITGGSIDGTTIGATTPSTGAFTTLNANSLLMAGSIDLDNMGEIVNVNRLAMAGNIDMENLGRIINLNDPVDAQDAVTKQFLVNELSDVYSEIGNLGSAFRYRGNVSSATTPFDLTTLADQVTGAYYKVDVAGAYTDGTTTFNAKVGDAFVKISDGGQWQKLDNVDVEVLPTANEISVTGDENVGYTVALASEFKDRVTALEDMDAAGRLTDLETKTQNIDLALTTAGSTTITGAFTVVATSGPSYMIRTDAGVVELNENGNTVGTRVHSTLDLVNSDWGLGDSTDGFIALQAAGHLVGVNHTYGGSSQMSKIENFIIDGGVY
jgi:hypothetical protein